MFLRKSHHMDPYFVYLLRMISLCLSGKKKWRFCLSNMDVIRAPFKHINWIYTILSVYFYISLSKKNIGSRKIYMYNFLKFFGVLDWHAPTQTCLNEGASWAGVATCHAQARWVKPLSSLKVAGIDIFVRPKYY
jgi:hypothetical protein